MSLTITSSEPLFHIPFIKFKTVRLALDFCACVLAHFSKLGAVCFSDSFSGFLCVLSLGCREFGCQYLCKRLPAKIHV